MRFSALFLLAFLAVFASLWNGSDGWRRRRRRWWAPQNCEVNGWGGWGGCNNRCGYGSQYRYRYVWRWSAWGGRGCPHLSERRRCGRPNGGCQQICSNGRCYCYSGYRSYSYYYCADINECSYNSGRGPCAHNCHNTVGSYYCSCRYGYYLSGRHSCPPVNCGRPPIPSCPGGAYGDQFGQACKTISIPSCTTTYLNYCYLNCPSNYRRALIGYSPGKAFAQDYSKVHFTGPSRVRCQGNKYWTSHSTIVKLYCRRINDPPTDLRLNSLTINEHSPVNTVVGLLSSIDYQSWQSHRYTIQHSKGYYIFYISGTQLRIKIIPRYQRSTNGVNSPTNSFEVKLRTTDDGNPNMYREEDYNIRILDVNDPPTNLRLSSYTVSEKATVGSTVGTLLADDEDSRTPNPCSQWKVDDSSSHTDAFKLGGTNKVVTAKSLDHESQKAHPIVITCIDYDYTSGTGRNKKTATATVTIDIKDEHEPPISITLDNDDVNENSATGTKVGTIVAQDQDVENLTFSLVAATISVSQKQSKNVNPTDKFKVDTVSCTNPTAGTIRTICKANLVVKGSLDYEDIETYSVIIFAYDSKNHHISKRLTLHVNDVNEAPTDVKLDTKTIDENSPAGTVIGNIDFEDPDNPDTYVVYPNGSAGLQQDIRQNPSCLVDAGKLDGGAFKIDGQYPNFELVKSDSTLFDYETDDTYQVSVTCDDHGKPSLTITKTFTVKVNDLNEPPTAIVPSPSPMSVKECVGIGTLVAKLSTVDQDAKQTYTYSIVAGNLSVFEIRGSNLVVKFDVIDFEAEDEYEITLETKDSGTPSYTFEDTFVVNVVDCPEPPTDIVWQAGGTLPENTPGTTPGDDIIGYNIGEVEVIDQDNNQNPQCKLLDNSKNLFNVSDIDSLVIIAGPRAKTIDYETMADHRACFKIRCTDTTGLYLDKELCVNITDVNEPPTNISLNGNIVPENVVDGIVGDITVSGDPDVGQKHNCSVIPDQSSEAAHQEDPSKDFYIKRVPEGDGFRNVLATKRALDYETISSHSFEVNLRCCDMPTDGQTSLCTEAYDFQVWIQDVDEAPESPCVGVDWYVSEKQPNGTNITGTLMAHDPDNDIPAEDLQNLTQSGQPAPQKQHLTYTLVNERSVPFVYNEQLQQIMVFGYIDYETHRNYKLLINVMDDGKVEDPMKVQSDGTPTYVNTQKLNKTFVCNVRVVDENEVHTKYDIQMTPIRQCKTNKDVPAVDENAVAGTAVATLTTNDPDLNDVHTYKIENDNEADIPFLLTGANKDKLEVKAGVPLDYEVKNQFSVTISSADKTGYKVARTFLICVENVNESPTDVCLVSSPNLIALKSFSTPENAVNSVIGQIIVDDPDRPSRHCPTATKPAALDTSLSFTYNCVVAAHDNSDVWEDDAFWIDSNLLLKTKQGLNYEDVGRRVASVPVRCNDASHPLQKPIPKTFKVAVTDVNEAPKNFMVQKNFTEYHMRNNTCWFRVTENTAVDIAVIKYTDEDGGQDHTFSVSPKFDERYFTVTAAGTGAFKISTSGLSAEAHNGACFKFEVTDNGQPPMTGFKTICFGVLNVPEPANALRMVCQDGNIYGRPDGSKVDETAFTTFNFKPTVTYGTAYLRTDCHQIRQFDFKNGFKIGTVVALDDDGQGQFIFSLQNYADTFSISPVDNNGNPTTGQAPAFSLSVKSATPTTSPKLAQKYNLKIQASGQDGLAATLDLIIRTYNECDSKVVQPSCGKNAYCSPTLTSYSCRCNAGLVGDPRSNDQQTWCRSCPTGQESDGQNPPACVDIDECASNPCQNGGKCSNGDNLFTCKCKPGFEGTLCETNKDDCSPNPCKNSGVCVDLIAQYRCKCQQGFTGRNCDQHISSCADDTSVCKVHQQCVYADSPKCVNEVDEAQAKAAIEAAQLQGNGRYGAETHIEYCIAQNKGGKSCSLSLVQSVSHANQPVRRAATGRRYMAKIISATAWPNNPKISLIQLVLFDRDNNYEVVPPSGENGTCQLLQRTDILCVTYSDCLDVNRLGKKCNPDVSGTDAIITLPSGKTPEIVNAGGIVVNPLGQGSDSDSSSDDEPFFKTLYGRITIVAVCVAIIIVVAVIVFFVVRNRKERGAYYEEFDEYDGDGVGMPNEDIDRDLPSMSGSMRQRARPRSGLTNPLYDAMLQDEDTTSGTIDNELYKPSDEIRIKESSGEGVTSFRSDMSMPEDADPLYDNPTFE